MNSRSMLTTIMMSEMLQCCSSLFQEATLKMDILHTFRHWTTSQSITRPSQQWPKTLPPLTEEQQRISDDFFKVWLETIPQRYGIVERFNHNYPLRRKPEGFCRTLDFGAGRGENMEYEDLDNQEYVALA